MRLRETIILPGATVRIVLEEEAYCLAYGELVVYENGMRRIRGRSTRYEFRSVEQLRYDFERDVEMLGGRLG